MMVYNVADPTTVPTICPNGYYPDPANLSICVEYLNGKAKSICQSRSTASCSGAKSLKNLKSVMECCPNLSK